MRILIAVLMAAAIFSCAGMDAGAQEVYLDNVVVVLDASGSMNRNMSGTETKKLSAAKTAIREVFKTIPETTHVGLLVFNDRNIDWVFPLGIRDDARLLKALDSITAGGGTPLGKYMKIGADKLLEARKAQFGYGSYRLLLVTDGEAGDSSLVEAYTPDIISRGIITDVIGVDMRTTHTLATKVHSYRRANDPAALTKAIQEVFAEVGKTSGSGGEDAFAELQGFPADLALPVITALTSSGNEPIGAKGRVASAGKSRSAAPANNTASQSSKQNAPVKIRNNNSGSTWKFIIMVIFVGGIISSIRKKLRR